MPTLEEIRSVVCELGKQYDAENIYLFGSYARGKQNENSDLDFRVTLGNIRGWKLGGLYSDLQKRFNLPIDIITTDSLNSSFYSKIKNDEIMLYERS